MEPIAHIRSPFPTKFGVPRQPGLASSLISTVEFCDAYRNPDAIRGIEGFSHLWLVWLFSHNTVSSAEAGHEGRARSPITVRPPRLGGTTRMGVYATRSSFRPNGIGLSCVKLVAVEEDASLGPVLRVSGADLVDGSPILDIKPYLPEFDSHPEAQVGWVEQNEWRELDVVIGPEQEQAIGRELLAGAYEVLRQDPRPAYTRVAREDREFWVPLEDRVIWFVVSGSTLTVTRVRRLDTEEMRDLRATGTIRMDD